MTAVLVAVSATLTVSVASAEPLGSGSISGVVTAQAAPLEASYVTAYAETGEVFYSTAGADPGEFVIEGLPPGSYKLEFGAYSGNVVSEWWDDQSSMDSATAIELTEGQQLTGVNADLQPGGLISGVVESESGAPIPDVWVQLYSATEDWRQLNAVQTDQNGEWSIDRLASGEVKVQYQPTAGYIGEWWQDAEDFASATALELQSGLETAVGTAVLAPGAAIAGRVTDESSSAPVSNANVLAVPPGSSVDYRYYASTDENGDYRIEGLPTGPYEVLVQPGDDHVDEWYPSTYDREGASPVEVIAGDATIGIDLALTPAAYISGVIADAATGEPVADVSVNVKRSGADFAEFYGYTASDGTYAVGGLPAGDYVIQASKYGSNYLDVWFDGALDEASAQLLPVETGTSTPDVNVALVTGGSISGTVTDADGAPIAGVEVAAVSNENGIYRASTTGDDGRYLVGGLSTGSYQVSFSGASAGYLYSEYPGTVAVVVGEDTGDVDAVLGIGGTITGTISEGNGSVIEGVQVCAEAVDFSASGGCTSTDQNGAYELRGLAPVEMLVRFDAGGTEYVGEWWNDQTSREAADPIIVTSGETTPNIDAQLAVGGAIEGVVTADTGVGAPLEFVSVTVSTEDRRFSQGVTTDSEGRYRVSGLPTGTYYVQFYPGFDSEYVPEYWNDAPDWASAEPVSVTAGSTTSGISAALTRGATVTGMVTDSAGDGVDGVEVYLAPNGALADYAGYFASTDDNGEYAVTGVRPGTYKVLFVATSTTPALRSEWWNDTQLAASAADLTVVSDETSEGVDAQLAPLGTAQRASAPVVSNLGGSPGATWTVPTSTEPILGYAVDVDFGGSGEGLLLTALDAREFPIDPISSSAIVSVRALTASGFGAVGHGVIVGDPDARPGPTVTATDVTANSVSLSFEIENPVGDPVTSWRVITRTDDPNSFGGFDYIEESEPNVGSITLSGLAPSTTYTFFVEGGDFRDETRFTAYTVTTSEPDPVPFTATPTPTISGVAAVGSTLTAVTGSWAPTPTAFSYQWLRAGQPIAGATGATYVAAAADAGAAISVAVTGSRPGYVSSTRTSSTVTVVPGTLGVGTPTVAGVPRVGDPLVASPGTWGPDPVALTYQWLRNGSPISGATTSTYTPVSTDVGSVLAVRVTGAKAGYTTASATSADLPAVVERPVIERERISGADRFATAAAIASTYAPGVDVVYVATGRDYPDALGAAAAAAHLGGPLLLVDSTSIPPVIAQQLARLDPELIVVVGGTGVVSNSVVNSLQQYAGAGGVRRDAGANRFETSRIVAERAFGAGATASAYVATGSNFPDALAASAAAGASGAPVILVNGVSSSVDAPTRSLLQRLGVASITVAGGTGVISTAMEQSLRTVTGVESVVRRAGANRYATAVAINQAAFATADTVFFATGLSFPDALAGAALAGLAPGPLYVVQTTCVPTSVLAEIDRLGATEVVLFGGAGVLSSGVRDLVPCG